MRVRPDRIVVDSREQLLGIMLRVNLGQLDETPAKPDALGDRPPQLGTRFVGRARVDNRRETGCWHARNVVPSAAERRPGFGFLNGLAICQRHTEPVKRDIRDPTDGRADGSSPYLWDKQLDGVLRVIRGTARPDFRRRPVRHVMIGLVVVVVVFVVVPILAILLAAN
jgi:hypothetical protein